MEEWGEKEGTRDDGFGWFRKMRRMVEWRDATRDGVKEGDAGGAEGDDERKERKGELEGIRCSR